MKQRKGQALAARGGFGHRGAHARGVCRLCSASRDPGVLPPPAVKTAEAEVSPAAQREHQRILAAYSGVYEDPRLEALVEQTVDKLVAASERPDLRYRVTILNSPAINAFALPSGQLYVTRGLIALANDTSELASVLSHEMAHVIARHAAIREDQARQVALVSRVVNDVLSDPESGALALAKSKITLASFSRAQEFEADGIGVGIAARAGYDPYGAVRFLSSMGRNAELKRERRLAIDPRAPDFLSSHPATPERVKNAHANARQFGAPASAAARDRTPISRRSTAWSTARTRAKASCAAGASCIPSSASPSSAPEGFALDNTAQAVLGVKTAAARRCGSMSCACRPSRRSPNISTPAGSRISTPRRVEEVTINGFPGATATAKGDQWAFRLYAIRFGSDVYRFIFAAKQHDAGDRPRLPRNRSARSAA